MEYSHIGPSVRGKKVYLYDDHENQTSENDEDKKSSWKVIASKEHIVRKSGGGFRLFPFFSFPLLR